MNPKEFESRLRKCKASQYVTGEENISVSVNPERTIFMLSKKHEERICKCCGSDLTAFENRTLIVEFKEKQKHLTIFEAGMLYAVFFKNQRPRDYAKYHVCPAGTEFIKNIREVRYGR